MRGRSRSWTLCLVAACARPGVGEVSAVAQAMLQAEDAFERRGAEGSLEPAIQYYLSALGADPRSIEARAGLSRAFALKAWSDGVDGLDGYRVAREQGLQCLLQEPVFRARVQGGGGRLTAEALEQVDAEHWECMHWAGWAWLRWVHGRSASAMALDHEVLLALAERGLELAPDSERAAALSLYGLALSLDDDRRREADEAFSEAIANSPRDLVLRLDRVEHILLDDGRLDEAQVALERIASHHSRGDDPRQLENKEAAVRAAQLLGVLEQQDEGADRLERAD